MKTLQEYKLENKNLGKKGKNFSPFRVYFNDIEKLKHFLGDTFNVEIEKAFSIARERGTTMTLKKQNELKSLGFELRFRGFNSNSGDVYVYQDPANNWFLSVGMSNINKAGRGYEIEL